MFKSLLFSFFKEKRQKIAYIIIGGKVIYKYYKTINERWLLKDKKSICVNTEFYDGMTKNKFF